MTPLEMLAGALPLVSLTISPNPAVKHRFEALATFAALERSQIIAALVLIQDKVRESLPFATRTGFEVGKNAVRVFFAA